MINRDSTKLTFVVILILLITACGGKKSEQLIINELGLTMNIPQDWQMEKDNNRLFYDPNKTHDTYGAVEDSVFQGQTLSQYVDSVYQHGFPVNIKSKISKKIRDYETIEVSTESVYVTQELFILRGNRVIHISLRCLKQDYPKWETQIRKSLDSVKIM